MRTCIRTYPPFDASRFRSGKFLQLELDGIPWLLFADPVAFRYHNQILAAFLQEHGVAHHWTAPEALEYDIQRVRIAGGGRFELGADAMTLELWDNSAAYGRFDAIRLQSQIAASDAPWSQLRIRIRDDAGQSGLHKKNDD